MELRQDKREWEDLADLDPMWAILSKSGTRDGGWQHDDFHESGRVEIERVMDRAETLDLPRQRRVAVDFGCGIGRLSRPLAGYFERCIGLDISERMVIQARALSTDVPNVEFCVNSSDRIPSIADGAADFIYSRIVLQHVSSRSAIRSYLSEFARILAPGGLLIFQLPSHVPWRHRLQPRPRMYSLLRRLGVSRLFLYRRLGLHPIRMRRLPADAVCSLLVSKGLQVITFETERVNAIDSTTYYATRAG